MLFSVFDTEQIVAMMDIRANESGIPPFETMTDNRDIFVMRSFNPPKNLITDELRRDSFKEEVRFLKFVVRILIRYIKITFAFLAF